MEAVGRVFERGSNSVENRFAECDAALEPRECEMPGAIADVSGKNIAAKAAEPLRVNNVEVAAEAERGWQRESKHRRESIGSPGRQSVEVDVRRAAALNPVGEYVNFMFFGESIGQLGHVAAMPTGAMIIMHQVSDLHAVWPAPFVRGDFSKTR